MIVPLFRRSLNKVYKKPEPLGLCISDFLSNLSKRKLLDELNQNRIKSSEALQLNFNVMASDHYSNHKPATQPRADHHKGKCTSVLFDEERGSIFRCGRGPATGDATGFCQTHPNGQAVELCENCGTSNQIVLAQQTSEEWRMWLLHETHGLQKSVCKNCERAQIASRPNGINSCTCYRMLDQEQRLTMTKWRCRECIEAVPNILHRNYRERKMTLRRNDTITQFSEYCGLCGGANDQQGEDTCVRLCWACNGIRYEPEQCTRRDR